MAEPYTLEFTAEVKEAKAYKKASLDKEYRVIFVTDQSNLMELSTLSADTLVKVSVRIVDQ